MYSLVYYTHSDYSDVWPIMTNQVEKYFPNTRKYMFVNADGGNFEKYPSNFHIIFYEDGDKYQDRVVSCLKQIEEEIVFFHHEDMFLFDKPEEKVLSDICMAIVNKKIDIVKMCRASYDEEELVPHEIPFVYHNPHNLQFAIQPSLCRKDKLIKVYEKTDGDSIWKFETNSSIVCQLQNIKTGMVYTDEDEKVGMFHWSSKVYPYTATAIVKGKWNYREYKDVLKSLKEKYSVSSDREILL